MGKSCQHITLKEFRKTHINVGNLTQAELDTTMSILVDKEVLPENFTTDDIIRHRKVVAEYISQARTESANKKKELAKAKEEISKIGNADLVFNSKVKKNEPRDNKDTLYLFTDNLQAHNSLTDTPTQVEGLIEPKNGVEVNVKGTSAIIRTDTNGDPQPNAIGIVVKKNAQDAQGVFISKNHTSKEASIFTEADREAFNQVNSTIIDRIAELTKGKEYTKVSMPQRMALDNAGLPRVLAEDLAKMLEEKLGLVTQVLPSEFGENLFGLEIQGKVQTKRPAKTGVKAKEALESLTKERPVNITPQTQRMSEKILMRVLPDIAVRRARVQLISQMFSKQLDFEVEKLQNDLEEAEELTEEEMRVLSILQGGSEIERRKTTLAYREEGSRVSVSDKILGQIKNLVNVLGNLQQEDGSISEDDITAVVEQVIKNPNNVIGAEYEIESQTSDVSGKLLRRRAKNIIEFCALVKNTPGVFEGLVASASNILENTENIKLSVDKSKVISTISEIEEMEDEESSENRDGLYLVKHKMLDPKTTLSFRIKRLLSHCYKVNQVAEAEDGSKLPVYEHNDLGMRIPLNSGVVYYNLLKRFSEMNSPYDFLPMVDRLEQEYPWFGEIATMIRKDDDLRNEFYRCFRQVPQIFAVITPYGKIQFKNAELDETAIIDMVTKNYEGCNVLSSSSLYNEEGIIDMNKVEMFRRLCSTKLTDTEKQASKTSSKEAIFKAKHPLAFVGNILSPNSKNLTVENLQAVHDILSGVDSNTTSLDNILKSLGIDTTDLDLNVLLPTIDWSQIYDLDDVDKVWSKDVRNKVYNVVDSLRNITKQDTGLKANSNLINDFRSTYLRIGHSLLGISEGYTQASFYFDGNQRFSYTHPDAISRLVSTISDISTPEAVDKGTRFLQEHYLKFDFFKNSPLLNTLMDDLDARKKLFRCEILAIQTGSSTRTSISQASNEDFLDGLIVGYFSGSSMLSKRDGQTKEFAYFRNPLFSDTETLNLFRLPKYSKADYQERIIDNLVTLAESEIKRILDYEAMDASEKLRIDRYNTNKRNAGKFCFLAPLESRKREILNHLAELQKSNSTDAYRVAKTQYLHDLIGEMMQDNCEAFLNSIGDTRKLRLFNLIRKTKANAETAQSEENNFDSNQDAFDLSFTMGEEEPQTQEDPSVAKLTSEEKIAEVNDYLTEFYYNDYYSQSQLIMLLGGDIAYYKDVRDFIKRCKQAYASGERIYAINEDGTPMVERVLYLDDRIMVSNTFKSLQSLLHISGLSPFEKELVAGSLRAFTDINSTDGQALRTLKSFKKVLKAMGGVWTETIDDAFNKISRGEPDLASWMNLVNSIKPFLFSYETKEVNGRLEKIPVQHKNSEYLLTALFSSLNTALNQSPELIALQKFMDLHDIDVMQFQSCVKEGSFNTLDLNHAYEAFYIDHSDISFEDWQKKQLKALQEGSISQEEFNSELAKYGFRYNEQEDKELVKIIKNRMNYSEEDYLDKLNNFQYRHPNNALVALELQMAKIGEDDTVHIIPMEDYMIAQPNSDHLTGAKALVGSQGRNIIPADLPDNFEITITVGNRKVKINKAQALKFYDTLFTDQILDNFEKLNIKFDDIKSVKAMLEAAMEGNPKYGEEIRKAFELNEAKDDFRMPMNSPTINNKAQDLMLSQFKNHIQRLHIDGGNAVLVSNFSLSDRLHVAYNYKKDKDGKFILDEHGNKITESVKYIPCYLPAFTREMYADYLEEVTEGNTTYYTINFEKVKQNNAEDLFNIIGYRIPTEDKYSMMPIKIVGFLPIQAGASMMLPSDIITMSGTDFDIDKLFLMRKSFRREIASKDLGIKFIDWVNENKTGDEALVEEAFLKKLTYISRDESGEIDELSERNRGFTYEEIQKLYHENSVFAEFIDSSEDALYKNPKYVPLRPRAIRDSKGNIDLDATSQMKHIKSFEDRQALRNNMILDMYWSILTSPEGSRQMMTPATYIHAKVSSRRERIMNDRVLLGAFVNQYSKAIEQYGSIYEALNHFAAIQGKEDTADNNFDALDRFIEEYANPDNPLDINFYIDSHRNLMDGNGLIGGLAVNSSRHYKFQLCTQEIEEEGRTRRISAITLRPDFQFNISIPGFGTHTIREIDPRISPITGIPVGRTCAELQAASPDNGKDPCLGDMGINMDTLKQTDFMTSIGLPAETIGFLNRLGDLVAVGGAALSNDKRFGKRFKLKKYVCDVAKMSDIATRYRLGEELTGDDIEELKSFSLWWNNLLKCADDLHRSSVFVRSDSPNGALPVTTSEVIQHLLKVKSLQHDIAHSNFSIDGLESVIDLNMSSRDDEFNEEGFNLDVFRNKILGTKIPRLQAWYTCGIKSATSLVERYLPEISDDMLKAIDTLQFLTGLDLTSNSNLPFLRTFLNDLTTYILSSKTSFSEGNIMDNRNFYIHDFPMHFKKFLDEKDSSGNYKHQDVRNLTLIKMLTNTSGNGIKFVNVGGKISPDSRQYFIEALDYMLQHEDPDVVDFATDLFNYSYFENGLNFGHSNFGIFFSVDFIDSMPGFNARLHEANGQILAGTFDFKDYVEQFLLNHPNLIPYVREDAGIFNEDKNTLSFTLGSLSRKDKMVLSDLNPATNKIEYRNFIKVSRTVKNEEGEDTNRVDVYQFTKQDGVKAVYTKVGYNSLKGKSAVSFYDSYRKASGIDWDKLQNKGAVISSKLQKKIADSKAKKDIAAATPEETRMKVSTDTEVTFNGRVDEERQEKAFVDSAYAFSSTARDRDVYNYRGHVISQAESESSWKAMEDLEKANPDLEDLSDVKEDPICFDVTKVKFSK